MLKKKCLALGLALLLALAAGGCRSIFGYESRLIHYAETHSSFTFGEVFDFSWDVAYNDSQTYQRGEWLKEKYGLDFTVDTLDDELRHRFLFFSDGEMVLELRYNHSYFGFPHECEVILPGTVFEVEWEERQVGSALYRDLKIREA